MENVKLTHNDYVKYYEKAVLWVNANCDCTSYRESADKVLEVMQAMKNTDESKGKEMATKPNRREIESILEKDPRHFEWIERDYCIYDEDVYETYDEYLENADISRRASAIADLGVNL